MTAVVASADFLGANVDLRAYVVLAIWFSVAVIEGPWCVRPDNYEERLRRYSLTLIFDTVMLGAAYYYLDAARIAGISAFLLIVVSARVLPAASRNAVIAAIIGVYLTLLAVSVYNSDPVASPVGLTPMTGNDSYLVASAVAAIAIVYLVLRMQAHVVRTALDSESRHRAVVQSAGDLILVVDERGHMVEVNNAVERKSGYAWTELKSMPNRMLFVPEEWDSVLALFGRALAGETVTQDVHVVTRGGSILTVEATVAPVQLGERPAVVVVARDITERRRQEAVMRQNEAKLDLVLNTLNSGFYTVDTKGIVTSVRGRGTGAGSAMDRLVGKPIEVIAPASEEAARQREEHARALAGEIVSWVWPVGTNRWIRSHVAPLRDADGVVIGAAGFWRDETELVREQTRAEGRWDALR
jgi:PAS domain S-box-containing protein